MSSSEYDQCIKEERDDFSRYEQYIDVVSCWEEFLTSTYKPRFNDFHFDRFPTMHLIGEGDPLTPDFSAYFNSEYGVVFEISRTLPTEDSALETELDQIRKYDQQLQFYRGDGESSVPDIHDIVLLISTTNSQTIERKVKEKIENGEFDLDSNFILMEYNYTDQDRKPRYQFRRLDHVDQNFRDDSFPESLQLSKKLSMDGGTFENIYVPVDNFYEYKATGVLCNDKPPEVKIACYLWHHVFFSHLSEAQKQQWRLKNPNKILEFSVTATELKNDLNNDYIPDASVRKDWIIDSLDYLVVAGVAEKVDLEEYIIRFRNLRNTRRKYSDEVGQRTKTRDLAFLFTEWYCRKASELSQAEIEDLLDSGSTSPPEEVLEDDEGEEEEELQSGLGEFM